MEHNIYIGSLITLNQPFKTDQLNGKQRKLALFHFTTLRMFFVLVELDQTANCLHDEPAMSSVKNNQWCSRNYCSKTVVSDVSSGPLQTSTALLSGRVGSSLDSYVRHVVRR